MRSHGTVDRAATESTADRACHDADRATDQRMAEQRTARTARDQTGRAARMAANPIMSVGTLVLARKGGRRIEGDEAQCGDKRGRKGDSGGEWTHNRLLSVFVLPAVISGQRTRRRLVQCLRHPLPDMKMGGRSPNRPPE